MAPNLELKVLIRCAPLSEMIFSVRADRLIALLLRLQSRGRMTASQVAAELEISQLLPDETSKPSRRRESRSTHSRGEVVAGALSEVLELI